MGEVTSACYNPDTPQFKQELSYTLAELSPGPTIEKIEYQPMPASIR